MNVTDQVLKSLPMGWRSLLQQEFVKPYWLKLDGYLQQRSHLGNVIYPPPARVFSAFEQCDLNKIRVVILGQDPYHGPGQANGLCFSVPQGHRIPPSLRNIFKELSSDVGAPIAGHGCLTSWAEQGVLLLNTVMTVEQGQPNSHADKGWETFTDRVIHLINKNCDSIVFMLWGSNAQKKQSLLDESQHLVLRSTHPSPLSAYRGFFGCGHFSRANQFLVSKGQTPIDWQLPPLPERASQIGLDF
jgi:uracil-DNA glycosylase